MNSENKELLIHVVCHTHDDPGWIWALDDYYMGTNKCNISVKRILDNMVISLSNNPERKFSYVEMKFFKRWYEAGCSGNTPSAADLCRFSPSG